MVVAIGTAVAHGPLDVVDRRGQLGVVQVVVELDLRGHEDVVGSEVHRAQVDEPEHGRRGDERGLDRLLVRPPMPPRRSTAPFISLARTMAMTTSRAPMAIEPTASHRGLPVISAIVRPMSAKNSPSSAPESSSSTTGSSGAFVVWMNRHQRLAAALAVAGLVHRGAQRPRLQHDGDAEDDERDDRALHLVRVDQLLDALVEREQAAEAEQHERDDERPEVALRSVAERMGGVGLALGRDATRTSAGAWLPVSASECIASASRPAEPVMTKPTSLATAMPRLARNAAMIALRLPSFIREDWHTSAAPIDGAG